MANKKITELPYITGISGSTIADNPIQNEVVPVVMHGTTNQITVENFSKFMNAYSATTGSAGNTFVGPQIINSTVTINGNEIVNGNVTISGKLTVNELVAIYETASVIFSSGSNIFGDKWDDVHTFTGSLIYNGVLLTNIDINTISRLQQTTQSLQVATASLQQATASIQAYTASADSRFLLLQQTTQSLQVATASLQFHSASVNAQLLAIQQTTQSLQVATASLQAFSSSVNDQLQRVYQTTQSLHVATASLQFHSASVDAQLLAIQQTTQSLQVATASLNAFTSSQLAVNLGNAIYTASVDSHIVGISTYTSSVRDTLARVHQATQSLQVATASLQQFTASQDSRNLTLSTVTGSLIGITNGLMAFTAALDNTYATDAQLYQLYQATRSIELHSGSMIGVTNGLMAYTASNTSLNTGLRGEVDGIEAYTASLKGQAIVSSSTQVQNYDIFGLNSNLYRATGSLIGITNGLMAFTAALDSTYATDAQLYQLYQATRSIELTTGSLIGITNGLMAFTASLDNTFATDAQLYQLYQATRSLELTTGSLIGITNGLMAFTAALDSTYATDAQLYQLYAETASIKAEIGGIELYTASLKAASIVSSSTQVQNYDVFALNSNLYNSTGSIKGEIAGIETYTASLKGAAIVSSSQQVQNYFTFAQTSSANTFYGNQSVSGSLRVTGSLKVGDWFHGEGVANTAKLDIRTASDRGLKINGASSSDVIITAYRGASDDMVRGMRLEGNGIGIYIGDGNANTGSSVASFNTNGLAFEAGKGIDFSATTNSSGTMTSELLNDYEEGTWTMGMNFSGGSTGITYNNNAGKYTKIGRQVTVTGYLQLSNKGSSTGDMRITGLPFTIFNDNGNYSAPTLWLGQITYGGIISAIANKNTTQIEFHDMTEAGVRDTIKDTDIANNSDIVLSLTYFTS